MTGWQLLGACAVSFLSTVLAAFVCFRRGFAAGYQKAFNESVVKTVTRQMVDSIHDFGNLCDSITKGMGQRT